MKLKHSEVILLVVFILILFLGIKTYEEYNTELKEKRMTSIKSQIIYYYETCYNEEKCTSEMTIEELYETGYLKYKYTNPYTEEEINRNAIIKNIDNGIIIEGLDN